jgi:hypothetical protein
MNAELTAAIVRILNPSRSTVGAEFLVSGDGLIAACAVAPDGTIVAGEESGRMHFLRLEGA